MTEEWKKRWRAYVEGRLAEEEKKQVEEELAKLEAYQEFLEEALEKGQNQSTVERKSFFSTVTLQSRGSTPIEAYGSAEVREENFLKTLQLLTKYESIARKVSRYHNLHLGERLAYIQEKGVRIYGIVVTGPTKELLKLKQEPWVRKAVLGEVRLWSWSEDKNSTSPEQ